ncbi:hypothetical protein [Nesterenkonia jeotgali]|uniref:Uncharacterized protein n=1 Tax=Nesterenkonia jeotgali TaxID=317018 RepID=A0A0W8IGD9_9MICC|nr:hypothetical protein [Nesterenkonia jeotgali]KUG58981.1 hypothetical protein AVL63_02870 [Nesterenkonia jeotgali]
MAEHSDDGRVLTVDKRTGKKYREHPHIVKMAAHLELAPSTKAKLKAEADAKAKAEAEAAEQTTTTQQVTEPERTKATAATKNQEK